MSTLGIIGGGQLGLYLCEAAHNLGISVAVISDTDDAPALQSADRSFIAPLDSTAALRLLLRSCDVITFDKEAIPDNTLAYLAQAEQQGHTRIQPRADTLFMLKDKGLQKTWLQQNKLPTLPFRIIGGGQGSPATELGQDAVPLVQKASRGGYDGRGVQILSTPESLQQLWDIPSIVEPYLADCREISVITARAATGAMQTYPPVSMEFHPELNAVTTVLLPAAIDTALCAAAVNLAERSISLLEGVGVFAIEMFVTPCNELLINEISPRVHNSGHLTLDACNVSQFEQHVRAVSGLPLVAITHENSAAMLNILYCDSMREHCPAKPTAEKLPESATTLYWYGKKPGSIGRKMGHINSVAPTAGTAFELANRALARLRDSTQEHAA